jgi:hypothetical protein
MNLVMIHLGGQIPEHFWVALAQVKKLFAGTIYTITPYWDDRLTGTMWRGQPSFQNEPEIKQFESNSWMKETYGDFWSLAFARLFYLEAVIRQYNLEQVVHIENDVLIYTDFAKIPFRECYPNQVAINPVGEKYDAFACVYIDKLEPMQMLNDSLIKWLSVGNEGLNNLIGEGMVNEMLLLRLCSIQRYPFLSYLPSLPGDKNADKLGYLFDPASYGQYIFGTGSDNIGWTGNHHYIGRAINKREIEVFAPHLLDNCPSVLDHGNKHLLANLHMHCKKLELGL